MRRKQRPGVGLFRKSQERYRPLTPRTKSSRKSEPWTLAQLSNSYQNPGDTSQWHCEASLSVHLVDSSVYRYFYPGVQPSPSVANKRKSRQHRAFASRIVKMLAGGEQLRWNRVVGAGLRREGGLLLVKAGLGVSVYPTQLPPRGHFGCFYGLQEWIASMELRILLLEE